MKLKVVFEFSFFKIFSLAKNYFPLFHKIKQIIAHTLSSSRHESKNSIFDTLIFFSISFIFFLVIVIHSKYFFDNTSNLFHISTFLCWWTYRSLSDTKSVHFLQITCSFLIISPFLSSGICWLPSISSVRDLILLILLPSLFSSSYSNKNRSCSLLF